MIAKHTKHLSVGVDVGDGDGVGVCDGPSPSSSSASSCASMALGHVHGALDGPDGKSLGRKNSQGKRVLSNVAWSMIQVVVAVPCPEALSRWQ